MKCSPFRSFVSRRQFSGSSYGPNRVGLLAAHSIPGQLRWVERWAIARQVPRKSPFEELWLRRCQAFASSHAATWLGALFPAFQQHRPRHSSSWGTVPRRPTAWTPSGWRAGRVRRS